MKKEKKENAFKTKISNRKILVLEGKDRIDFLQNIVTNNIELVKTSHSIYSTLLNPQGKFLFDFIIFNGGNNKKLFIDCDKNRSNELVQLLNMYKLRKDVKISSLSNIEIKLIYGSYKHLLTQLNLKELEGSTAIINENIFIIDPRNKNLGIRLYCTNNNISAKILSIKNHPISKYEKLRINLGIPDVSVDLDIGKSFLIENNFEELNAIDFNKGCYIGQENTARQKYRSTSKRLLTKIKILGPKIPIGEEIKFNNRKVGIIRSSIDNIGLATIRKEVYDDIKSKKSHINILNSKIKFTD